MRPASWFVCLVGVLVSSASAQEPIHWQPNLESAQALAAKTNRLVLIHFWAPWCVPCMNLDKNVFSQPETGPALEANFVMVKLNADDSKATARIYQVKTLPTDVIVTPSGRLIAAIPSPAKPQQYIAQMNQAAEGYRRLAQGPPDGSSRAALPQNPYGAVQASTAQVTIPAMAQATEQQAPPYAGYAAAGAAGAGAVGAAGQQQASIQQYAAAPGANMAPPAQQQPSAPQYAPENNQNGYGQPVTVKTFNVPASAAATPPPAYGGAPAYGAAPGYGAAAPGAQPPPPQAAAAGPPGDALDGYCCVTLVENKKWVRGDPRFGAIHRGRVYKFTSQEAQQRFLANPDAFSPVIQGNDPVMALDARQAVPGSREHGLFYQNRIYLFSSEESLKRFQASPSRYAAEVTQAMR